MMLPPACNSLRDWFAEDAERVGHGEVHGFTQKCMVSPKTAWPRRKLALGWHSVGHFGIAELETMHAWLSHLVGPYSSLKGLIWDWHYKQLH